MQKFRKKFKATKLSCLMALAMIFTLVSSMSAFAGEVYSGTVNMDDSNSFAINVADSVVSMYDTVYLDYQYDEGNDSWINYGNVSITDLWSDNEGIRCYYTGRTNTPTASSTYEETYALSTVDGCYSAELAIGGSVDPYGQTYAFSYLR